MKLPGHDKATVSRAKTADYLLSSTHPAGHIKARWFRRFGFSRESWRILAEALLQHAAHCDIARIDDSSDGKRYVVEGKLISPDGRNPVVRSVWYIDSGQDTPRFVTAYPLRKGVR